MSRYSDQTVTLVAGVEVPVPGVAIYVYDRAGALATLTDDASAPLANPVTSDAYGNFYFNAPADYYNLTFHYGGKQIDAVNNVIVGTGPILPTEILDALSLNGTLVTGASKSTRSGIAANPIANLAVMLADKIPGLFTYQTGNFSSYVTDDLGQYDYIAASGVSTAVGAWVRAVNRDEYNWFSGAEYLGPLRANLIGDPDSGITIVYDGDSTATDGNGVTAEFRPDKLLKLEAMDHGARRVDMVLYAHPGESTKDFVDTHIDADIAATSGTPQGWILRVGVNDYDNAGDNLTVDQSIANFTTIIAKLRAAYPVTGTAIIVMGPNAAIGRGRDEADWDELITRLRHLCRLYKCAFFDTYGFARNARFGYNWLSWDNLSGSQGAGAAAHPQDTLQGLIHAELGRHLFGGLGDRKTNRFWVRNPGVHALLASELPADFATTGIRTGVVVDQALAANGFLEDGMVITILPYVPGDQIALQILAGNTGIYMRFGGLAWLAWGGIGTVAANLTAGTGYTQAASELARAVRNSNVVSLDGNIIPTGAAAILTAGQAIATVPSGYRPLNTPWGIELDVYNVGQTPPFETIKAAIDKTTGVITARTASTYQAQRVYFRATYSIA